MSSRYPKRKRVTIDYAAIAAGKPPVSKTPKTSVAQAIRIPKTKRQATSGAVSKASKPAKRPGRPPAKTRTVIERPEPEPLDQNSDGGPDPLSTDPDVDSSELSDISPTESMELTEEVSEQDLEEQPEEQPEEEIEEQPEEEVEEEVEEELEGEYDGEYEGEYDEEYEEDYEEEAPKESSEEASTTFGFLESSSSEEPSTTFGFLESSSSSGPTTAHSLFSPITSSNPYTEPSTSRSLFSPSPPPSKKRVQTLPTAQNPTYEDLLYERELPTYATSSASSYVTDSDPEAGAKFLQKFPAIDMDEYRPSIDPTSTLSMQEMAEMIGTVTFFAKNVNRMRIDITQPLSVMRGLYSRLEVWDDETIDWVKYRNRAWRHRWHVANELFEMPMGDVAALADVAMKFVEDLRDLKGIDVLL
ncbi:uncharacterized protein GGS22DRAFT_184942 [Annulohypoxylon maeteangense]|uniref:uncharacterized protein n=1 Tax=Annulohypoxylon maeteangense TaxID=1927788 RepID=UPI0020075323|nr:uncharacterized protein GGS22DRAFT_184942 [Annulohypoxylon maeteangense]KAI0889365.1 hypothetical protein GGS22DRAFT_184942 [Annulohypoxylon maeteangense]